MANHRPTLGCTPECYIFALLGQLAERRKIARHWLPSNHAVLPSSGRSQQIEREWHDVKMRLVNAAPGGTPGPARAMLETVDSVAGAGERIRDQRNDRLERYLARRVETGEIEHRTARHDKCPPADERTRRRQGDELLSAKDLPIPRLARTGRCLINHPRKTRDVRHCQIISGESVMLILLYRDSQTGRQSSFA